MSNVITITDTKVLWLYNDIYNDPIKFIKKIKELLILNILNDYYITASVNGTDYSLHVERQINDKCIILCKIDHIKYFRAKFLSPKNFRIYLNLILPKKIPFYVLNNYKSLIKYVKSRYMNLTTIMTYGKIIERLANDLYDDRFITILYIASADNLINKYSTNN